MRTTRCRGGMGPCASFHAIVVRQPLVIVEHQIARLMGRQPEAPQSQQSSGRLAHIVMDPR